MSIDNPVIQFAIVREDPHIDAQVIDRWGCKNLLLVGSGGCTALTLNGLFQGANITVFDPNPGQLALIEKKSQCLNQPDFQPSIWNIGEDLTTGLNGCGQFESLFRCFRHFIHEFVCPREAFLDAIANPIARVNLVRQLQMNPYWSSAFTLFFHDELLTAMFSQSAIQYAPPGSYPAYFCTAFEKALLSPSLDTNHLMHHLFLGHYMESKQAWPYYLQHKAAANQPVKQIPGYLDNIPDLSVFDFIMLSNIFDWMAPSEVADHIDKLLQMAPGAILLWRRLNNHSPLPDTLTKHFHLEKRLSEQLLYQDASFFYNQIIVARKR